MFWGKKHITEKSIQAKQQLLIGAPAVPPSENLVRALKDLLPLYVEVKEAYIFMKGLPNEKPVITIGVYFLENVTSDRFPSVFASIGQVIQPYLADQEDMDMMLIKGGIYETVRAIEDSLIYPI